MLGREGGQEKVRFEGSTFAGLVYCGESLSDTINTQSILLFFRGTGECRWEGGKNVQVNRARIVSASSPVRRRGSILKLAPSSSPTAISPCATGSIGPGWELLCHRRAGEVAEAVVLETARGVTNRLVAWRRTDCRSGFMLDYFFR